ncbi:MAG: hypothetical protein FWF97_04120 [Alphaproteobacteria bacterium]|nr:hypothetical protein [Alphaproteobacteria bacterium]
MMRKCRKFFSAFKLFAIHYTLFTILCACATSMQRQAEQLENQPDVIQALKIFGEVFAQDGCDTNMIKLKNPNDGYVKALFVERGIDPGCFYSDLGEQRYVYDDYSDECVLERRNLRHNSKICFFDYKRFFPRDTRITSDEEFMTLFSHFQKWFSYDAGKWRIKMCEDPEMTRSEKAECKDDVEDFIVRLSMGKARSCKDQVPGEYNKVLADLALRMKYLKHPMANAYIRVNAEKLVAQEENLDELALYNLCYVNYDVAARDLILTAEKMIIE